MFNYADGCCYKSQQRSKKAAELFGDFEKVFACSRRNLDERFCKQNASIINRKRGGGLWIWKYHLAIKFLSNDNNLGNQIPENSYVCYCDSDLYFFESINQAINCMKKSNESVMIFRSWNWYESSSQTKRDAFILCGADEEKYVKTAGRVGGFWIFKKDDFSRNFFGEMAKYSVDQRIIVPPPNQPQYNVVDPLDNQMGKPNYPKFLRHSEDEALISIMAKKYSLYPYRFPVITKQEEDARVAENLKSGGWCSGPEAYTRLQYPELIPNKSDYSKFVSYSQDTD